MPFTDEEVTLILDKIRKLRQIVHSTSASRYVTTWSYRGGQWHLRDWQEGETIYDGPMTEEEMRAHVKAAPDAESAQRILKGELPDLVLLDWMLPGESGLALARRWRGDERTRALPFIMLTARAQEADKVAALDAGADDYLTKPFSPKELLARIRAVLRRSREDDEDGSVQVGNLRIDGASHRVFAGDQQLQIGPTEYRLLHFFMTHADRVYTRTQVLDHVWGGNVYVEERTIDVHIRRLRKALEEFGYDRLVQTVRGAGYRFSTRLE